MKKRNTIDSDVLIIGGGLAGCMAALGAGEQRVKITIVEKANVRRSGGAGTGIFSFRGVFPDKNSMPDETPQRFATEFAQLTDQIANVKALEIIGQEIYERMLFLEGLGLKIRKDDGTFAKFQQGGKGQWLVYVKDGGNLKPILDKAIRDHNIEVFNRVMITDLITDDGRIAGAFGVNVRTGETFVFRSKAVVLATGPVNRAYRSSTGVLHHTAQPPHDTGDGHAMAYRAGAKLVNLEFGSSLIYPKDMPQAGLWAPLLLGARLINSLGEPVIKRFGEKKSDKEVSHQTIPALAVDREIREGRGPCYFDFTKIPEENLGIFLDDRLMFRRYFKERGIDLHKEWVEMEPGELRVRNGAGILINENAQTSLTGLYVAGESEGGIGYTAAHGALVLGWRAGKNAADYATSSKLSLLDEQHQLLAHETTIRDILGRSRGIKPREMGIKLANTLSTYAGYVRNQKGLETGLKRVQRLQEDTKTLCAKNPHELMEALEVRNLAQVGEMVIRAALMRQESRINHFRSDFPKRDDEHWLKYIVVQKKNDQVALSLQEIPGKGNR
jgi:succinate dehydrogenase/fumarate reductase flavoprotein subunit